MKSERYNSGNILMKAIGAAGLLIAAALIFLYLIPDNGRFRTGMPDDMPAISDESGNSGDSSVPDTEFVGEILAGRSSLLLDFNKKDYDAAIRSSKLVVLYFYANWCPICRLEFPLMKDAFNELSGDSVIGFRVNYNDSGTDEDEIGLAREFGVAYQHTKVFLKDGRRILKSPESWSKARYLEEINKFIPEN